MYVVKKRSKLEDRIHANLSVRTLDVTGLERQSMLI
jgi:hypothetical protein